MCPSANGWRQLAQLAPNACKPLLPISLHISANGLQKRFMNSDTLWQVPMLLLAKLTAEHLAMTANNGSNTATNGWHDRQRLVRPGPGVAACL